jgi:hypothetical protein
MRNPGARVSLRVEAMESRELLAVATPVLTMHTVNTVVADVKTVVGALAKTHDFGAARTGLTNVSSEVPFGRRQLSPTWLADLGIYNARVPGSGLAMQKQILNDLNLYILGGVGSGKFRVIGPGSAAFHRPGLGGVGAPAVSTASVTIVNNTGYNITVAASLNGTSQSITRQIANNGSALFDFQSSSTNFISVNIARTDGGQPPPPSLGNRLSRPISGYHGASFPISVFAGLFSVGQG